MKFSVFFLMCLIMPHNSEQYHVLSIFKLFGAVSELVKTGWKITENYSDIRLPYSLDNRDREILDKLSSLDRQFEMVSARVYEVGEYTAAKIIKVLKKAIKTEVRINDLTQYMASIHSSYRVMQEYAQHHEELEEITLEGFAKSVVSHDADSVRNLIEKIYNFVVPSDQFSNGLTMCLFDGGNEEMDASAVCNAEQSPQQVLYNLYNTIAITELKGYAMVQFSYMLLKLYGKGNFTKEAELSEDRFKERSLNTIKAVKNVMEKASRELWRCEPRKQISGETYLELTQLLQGYIQNEVDLNSEGTCRENCAEYTYTKSHSCFQNLYCRQQRRCKGTVLKCQYIDSDMWICPSNATTHRRYEYIEYENGRVIGRKQNCPKGRIQVDSWWRWLFWHCSYCLCLCDEEGIYSDRYLSLKPVVSDFHKNRVVTGLRFTKHNRLIHLQIQEGQLLPHGVINNETLRWVPVDDFQIHDRSVYNGQDYHTFTWENRAIDLDDIQGHEDHVLIGVKFKKVGSHINFEILVSPFDFETGNLTDPDYKSVWVDNVKSDYNNKKKLDLERPDIPTRAIYPAQVDSKSGMYLEFTHTDIDKDAAQTTVPFFDAQNVKSFLPVPLSGAGIYHKGQRGFGGYIAPKIITYDYSKHLMSSLDMDAADEDEDVLVN